MIMTFDEIISNAQKATYNKPKDKQIDVFVYERAVNYSLIEKIMVVIGMITASTIIVAGLVM